MSAVNGTDPAHLSAALREVSRIGPYFAIEVGGPGAAPPPGHRPLRELYRPGPLLDGRIAEVGRRLRTDERRVAASTLHLGIASRLWSVALGTAVLAGVVPDLPLDRTHWRFPPQGPVELWTEAPEPLPPTALHQAVVVRHLEPLHAALRGGGPLSERLLWGNAASALVGTLRVLRHAVPSRAPLAEPLVRDLLARVPLAGSGTLSTALTFRRTSCCLYYRAPGGGLCGDCVLTTTPVRRAR